MRSNNVFRTWYRTKTTYSKSSMDLPRYTGGPVNFLRTPLELDPKNWDKLDIGLVGVPFDGGITNRPGARFGPRAVREASAMERKFHHITKINPYDICNIADVGDVILNVGVQDNLEKINNSIRDFYKKLHQSNTIPLTIGGDHSITYPIFQSIVSPEKPISMIHFDAHTDTWDEFMGTRLHHGAPFRWAVEEGLLDPKRTVQIGIRGAQNTDEGWDYSLDKGMRVMFMEEVTKMGIQNVLSETLDIVGDTPTYISFDVDVLDPVYAPGTGTPEIGGLTTIEALELMRGLRGLNLIGADIVEVSPPYDIGGTTSLAASRIMYELVCLLAESSANRKKNT